MMLDERKKKILSSVINEFIRTGEPVGSKAVSSVPGIDVSAATVRNDMSVLEQLGFLEQPHTSSGRIPTYAAYQMYIDEFMPRYALTEADKAMLDGFMDEAEPTAESLIDTASNALSELTRCAVISSNIVPKFSVISKVEVVPTGKRMYVILLITSNGTIKNKVCRLQFDLSDEQLKFFETYMQENLHGVSVDELTPEMFENLVSATGAYMVALSPLLEEVKNLAGGFADADVTVKGEKNLLVRPEIDQDALGTFLEHKNEVAGFLDDSFGDLQIAFGGDGSFIVNNTGMVLSKIKKGGKSAGALGILGPLRIDYAKIIPYIEYLTGRISEILTDNELNIETE
ncbi:MAG: heat-inducible transcriptional repressor HrcA [Ruminococcus sp.]|jgi:heat-inducible transcriptional repressor|nr:heat-inducible transcriptional repressor HrcA [Ruminococcus sp.]